MINLWYIVIALEILRNWYVIERAKARPNYLISFFLRGMAAIAIGIFMDVSNTDEWWPVLSFQCASFFVLFSVGLNLTRKKAWDYLGNDSGWLDEMAERHPSLYWILYGICLTVFVNHYAQVL